MMAMLMAIRASFDPKQLGPTVLEYLARSLERGLAARDRLDAARFFDVDFRAFTADPLGTLRRIYGHFGLELGAETESRLAAYVRENPKGKHGAHDYSLEEYGLSAEAVRERLRFYTSRFGAELGG
jgi:hypothetical protein